MLIPAYGRPEIFALSCRSLRRAIDLTTWIDFSVMTIVSPEDVSAKQLQQTALDSGFDVCLYKNKPIGEKLNAGISALGKDYDYLMNWGSDDLINPKLFDLYKPLIKQGHQLFGIGDYLVYDSRTGAAIEFSMYHAICGAGRMIHRAILEWVNYRPYNDRCERGLDGNSYSRIRNLTQMTARRLYPEELMLVDIKSDININTFNLLCTFKNCIKRSYKHYDHNDWKGWL